MGRRDDTIEKLIKALTAEKKKSSNGQQPRRSNGWDCRCGTLDNRPTRATCRDCGAKAPQAFLRRLEQRTQNGGSGSGGQPQRRQPTPTSRTETLSPSWAEIAAGSPPGRNPTKGTNKDAPAPSPEPTDEASEKEAALQEELKKAKAMLAAAKANDLDESTLEVWQNKVNSIGKLLDQNRPHDARLRSLLDRKKDRETRLEKLGKDEQEAEAALGAIRANQATARSALAEIEAEIDLLTAQAVKPPAPPEVTPADLVMNRLLTEQDPAKQQALVGVLRDLGCTDTMIQERGLLLQTGAIPPTPAPPPAGAPVPPAPGAQKRPAGPTLGEAKARLEAARAARETAHQETLALEALLDPGATPPVLNPLNAAAAAEAEAAKKARTAEVLRDVRGGPRPTGTDANAVPPTVPDSSDDEVDAAMVFG